MIDVRDSEETDLDTVVETDDQQCPRDEEGRSFGERRSDDREDATWRFEGFQKGGEGAEADGKHQDDVYHQPDPVAEGGTNQG